MAYIPVHAVETKFSNLILIYVFDVLDKLFDNKVASKTALIKY